MLFSLREWRSVGRAIVERGSQAQSGFLRMLRRLGLALAVWTGAASVQAQALVGLVSPQTGLTDLVPHTSWAVTPYEQNPPTFPGNDDWTLDAATVSLDVTVPQGITLGACDVDVTWTSGAFTFASFDPSSLFPAASTFVLASGNGVRVNAARLGDNATTGAGATLGTLRLALDAVANASVQVAAVDCRAFDGTGGQTDVAVAPGPPARVGILRPDVAARVDATTTDNIRGDGVVEFEDLQVLLAGYRGASDAASSFYARYRLKLDFGARIPAVPPDGLVDFEDLQVLLAQYRQTAFTP